jgi:hypothetical protein
MLLTREDNSREVDLFGNGLNILYRIWLPGSKVLVLLTIATLI